MNADAINPHATSFSHTPSSTHPSFFQRKIIHFDMDCFYAAVEIRDNPALEGKPIIVGGSPDSRAVVCTASYEARRYGIHSAMACATAKRLCPSAIFITPHFAKYQEASEQIHHIFRQYTTLIEPLSLDEAYLDVTQNSLGLYAVKIARRLQREIYHTTGLTGSAGVAPNKLVAKIASDRRKPCGLTVVQPHEVTKFMRELPLRKIPGIGPASEKKLHALGFSQCQDLWPLNHETLYTHFGERMGNWLHDRCRGIDPRPLQTQRVRKSIGKEDTFPTDLRDGATLREHLAHIANRVAKRLAEKGLAGHTVTLKVKYATFQQSTRSTTFSTPIYQAEAILSAASLLLARTKAATQPVRLVGIALSKLIPRTHEQPCFTEPSFTEPSFTEHITATETPSL